LVKIGSFVTERTTINHKLTEKLIGIEADTYIKLEFDKITFPTYKYYQLEIETKNPKKIQEYMFEINFIKIVLICCKIY